MKLCYPLRKWIVPTEVVILGGFGSSAMEIVIPVRRKDGIGPSGKEVVIPSKLDYSERK
jgi:hypothetical protein